MHAPLPSTAAVLFVSSDAEHLYRMSVEDGLNLSINEAMHTCGAPLVIDLRKDCSLGSMFVGDNDINH